MQRVLDEERAARFEAGQVPPLRVHQRLPGTDPDLVARAPVVRPVELELGGPAPIPVHDRGLSRRYRRWPGLRRAGNRHRRPEHERAVAVARDRPGFGQDRVPRGAVERLMLEGLHEHAGLVAVGRDGVGAPDHVHEGGGIHPGGAEEVDQQITLVPIGRDGGDGRDERGAHARVAERRHVERGREDRLPVAVGGEPRHGGEERRPLCGVVERQAGNGGAEHVGTIAVAGHRPSGLEECRDVGAIQLRMAEHRAEDVGAVAVARHRRRGRDHPAECRVGDAGAHGFDQRIPIELPGGGSGCGSRRRDACRIVAGLFSSPRRGRLGDLPWCRSRTPDHGDRHDGRRRERADPERAPRPKPAAGRAAVEDGEEPSLELGAARHRHRGHGAAGGAVGPHDVEQVIGIGAGPGAELDHGVVAGALTLVAEALHGDPRERVEPVGGERQVGDPLGERVAPAHVGQLVGQHDGAALVVPGLRIGREPDHGLEHAPGHGHGAAVALQQGDAATESQAARDRVRGVEPAGVGHHPGVAAEPPDAGETGEQAQQDERGAGHPEDREQTQPVDRRGHGTDVIALRSRGYCVGGSFSRIEGERDRRGRRDGRCRRDLRKGADMPGGQDGAEQRQDQHAGEGEGPDEVARRGGGATHEARHAEGGEQDERRLEGPGDEGGGHCPSLRARSMRPASRSSSAGDSFSSSTSALTTCSALPPKKVRTRWVSAELRARSRGTVGA